MSSPGETSLSNLLSSLRLTLDPNVYVFMTFPPSTDLPATLFQKMSFRESEGLTVIATIDAARLHQLNYTFPSCMITCEIHSSLEAVGFIPQLTGVLATRGIGCNPISGFYHDHLFVPEGRAIEAIEALTELSASAKAEQKTPR